MHFHEIDPDPMLAPYVWCYWEFTSPKTQQGPYLHRVMPDGCIHLAYARRNAQDDSVLLLGPRLGPLEVWINPSEIYWGVKCWPGAPEALLHIAASDIAVPSDLARRHLSLLATQLEERLPACATISEAATVFDDALLEVPPRAAALDPLVQAGVRAIIASEGQARMSEIASQLGISKRQFQRRFSSATGITPKQFARIRRFRSSASNVLQSPPDAWGQVAAAHGYADQAHMIREFTEFSGLSPTAFQKQISLIYHGDVSP
jgi:AraC-like DNA-binding protein